MLKAVVDANDPVGDEGCMFQVWVSILRAGGARRCSCSLLIRGNSRAFVA